MNNDWNPKEPTIQLQQIIQNGDAYAVTLSEEMLDHLKVIEGENVQVEMREHELVIRKIIPVDSSDGLSADYFQTLNEASENYDTTETALKES
ncbi:hypothetical protein [Sporosarcina limicola]|uniref:Antitoxin component of MazEF toxin-antitoxin module n=1 Tax=Sporosarcina limicola TaxID=34101 RepID=A0A927MHP7_9BACL|nr:hypothetical protein [Sporosarcina limicola]MBE1553227.1 antitoxin component of MazEF toxin-antitoxin module [Sporosarcina limicola]